MRSLARQERKAEFQLLLQRFRVFFPRVTKTLRHRGKLRTVHSAIFQNYMFVVLDLHRDRWRAINGTYGVASLIMAGETPEPVPYGIVEQLLGYADGEGLVHFDRDLSQGQSVRVTAGPFANVIGRLERLDASGRVRVLLDIMGGNVPAVMNRSAVEAA